MENEQNNWDGGSKRQIERDHEAVRQEDNDHRIEVNENWR